MNKPNAGEAAMGNGELGARFFHRLDAFADARPAVSKHWRHGTTLNMWLIKI